MPTYDKRPGGGVRARVRVEPFPVQSKTFERKEDARLWAEPLEAELKKKKRAGLLDEELYTYAELIDDYLEHQLPNRKSDAGMFRQKALWWQERIGDKILADVRTRDIARIRDDLLNEPLYSVDINGRAIGRIDEETGKIKRKAPATVHKYLSVLSAMCRHNINERGWLSTNPVLIASKPKIKNDRVRFLSEQERSALLIACQNSENRLLHPVVIFALYTGARRNEVLKLTVRDINPGLTKATLRDTKNGDTRTVHIPPIVRERLLVHLQWLSGFYRGRQAENKWLFPREDGKAPIAIRKAWETARKEAALSVPSLEDFRFHDLRHTFASYLAMTGATLLQLKEALGHKTLRAVERYAHLTEDHTQQIVELMATQRPMSIPANDNCEPTEFLSAVEV